MMFRTALILLALSGLIACTGALNPTDVRRGNYNAPPELQIAEDCKSSDPQQDCKVIISHPPEKDPSKDKN